MCAVGVQMKTNSVYIILNPNAAKGKALLMKDDILKGFKDLGIKTKLVLTTAKKDAIKLAYDAVLNKEAVIVAAGGDGTCNEVADGMLKARREKGLKDEEMSCLGILPIGRGNDFSFSAELLLKLDEAIAVIAKGFVRKIDSGYLITNEKKRSFINGCGLGFEPLVTFTASDYKHIGGTFSYLCAMIKILIKPPKPVQVTLTLDGEEININSMQISICNGKRMGGAFYMGPKAIIDDGFFDVVYLKEPIPHIKLLHEAIKFNKGTELNYSNFGFKRCKKVKLAVLNGSLPIHVDGEEISRVLKRAELFLEEASIKLLSKEPVPQA